MAQIIPAHRIVEELMEACRAEPAKANGDRLQPNREIASQLVTQLDDEKPLSPAAFFVNDPDGAIKLAFFKRLAFEGMALDVVTDDSEDLDDAARPLTDETILEKAKRFVAQEKLTNIQPHHLAADVKATRLLRQVGADGYAFANPTIQEYLAAAALAEHSDYEKIFCRAFFNPTLVETEVLPMALGLVEDPNIVYTTLLQLPESLNYANLRLRARGLRYASRVNEQHLSGLLERLVNVVRDDDEIAPYSNAIIVGSFSGAIGKFLDRVIEALASVFYDNDAFDSWPAAQAIAKIGGDKALEVLHRALQSEDVTLRGDATSALGTLGDKGAVNSLIAALDDESDVIRWRAVESLGKVGDERAINKLVEVLITDAANYVRWDAAKAIGEIDSVAAVEKLKALNHTDNSIRGPAALALGMLGDDQAVEILLEVLKDENSELRTSSISALGQLGDECAVPTLLRTLKDKEPEVRRSAAYALIEIDGERAVSGLIQVLADEVDGELSDIHWLAAEALGEIGGERAVNMLLDILEANENMGARWRAAEALGKIGGEKAVAGLFEALNNDESKELRRSAALALGKLGCRQVMDECLEILNDGRGFASQRAVEALGEIGGEHAVPELLAALVSNKYFTRREAASALRKIKGEALADGLVKALSHENSSVRQRATEVIVYYTDSDQALKELSRVAAADPDSEIRTEARKAQEQFYRRLYYFRKEPSLLLAEQIGREAALEETRAFIAHEVKSAIGPLRIVAQLLNEAVQSPGFDRDKLSEYTERILKQTEAAYDVVNQYVDYTKPLRLKRELTDINQLIEHSLDEVRADCGQRSIDIIRRFDPAAHASVDRSLMSQVVRNVLLNAIEAMEAGGALTITTRLEENQIVIQVGDTGAGLKPDDLSRVFELGFTTKLGKRGAGIGLALARRIIGEGHEGSISVANNTEGKGATVIIKLPVAKEINPDGKQSLATARS